MSLAESCSRFCGHGRQVTLKSSISVEKQGTMPNGETASLKSSGHGKTSKKTHLARWGAEKAQRDAHPDICQTLVAACKP